jgi:hypothetical protein
MVSPRVGSSFDVTGWLPLLILPAAGFCLYNAPAWVFMWALAFAIFFGLKWMTWWKARSLVAHTAWRSVAYLLAWPGMDASSFLRNDDANRVKPPPLKKWFWGSVEMALGLVLIWAVARHVPPRYPILTGWVGMVGLIFVLHFGFFQLLALFWQTLGIDAVPIMSAPLRSESLSEFWGKRWNLGFRQLAHDLVFDPLHKRLGVGTAGFLVFVLSGLIHDLVISVPARGGYGRPTAYFVLQGIGVTVERSRVGKQLGLRKGLSGWVFMALVTVGPVFLLFHPPFVLRVIIPFMKAIRSI